MTIVHGRERAISGIFSYSMSNMLLSSSSSLEILLKHKENQEEFYASKQVRGGKQSRLKK